MHPPISTRPQRIYVGDALRMQLVAKPYWWIDAAHVAGKTVGLIIPHMPWWARLLALSVVPVVVFWGRRRAR